jgi:hypothetical protein
MENSKNMTIKIGLIDYVSINQIQLFILKSKKIRLSKKAILSWIINSTKIKILKNDTKI